MCPKRILSNLAFLRESKPHASGFSTGHPGFALTAHERREGIQRRSSPLNCYHNQEQFECQPDVGPFQGREPRRVQEFSGGKSEDVSNLWSQSRNTLELLPNQHESNVACANN